MTSKAHKECLHRLEGRLQALSLFCGVALARLGDKDPGFIVEVNELINRHMANPSPGIKLNADFIRGMSDELGQLSAFASRIGFKTTIRKRGDVEGE